MKSGTALCCRARERPQIEPGLFAALTAYRAAGRIAVHPTSYAKTERDRELLFPAMISLKNANFEVVIAMKKTAPKPEEVWTEIKCSACNGTGFPTNIRSILPGRKIYPPPCSECAGKGRIRKLVR